MQQPISISNVKIQEKNNNSQIRDLHFTDRILERPTRNITTIDLNGHTIYAGLVNAHDHLELNHYPRTKYHNQYDNAHQWGDDVNKRLGDSPFKELQQYPLKDRLFIGGLKNLLSGATTVIHHNPPHKHLFRRDFPVNVFKHYAWSHSLHFSTDQDIQASYRNTPKDGLWFIHLAEGTDKTAHNEYQRLKSLSCINKNTVIIHGVGLSEADIADCAPKIKGLVICPTTNRYLLDALPNIQCWLKHGGEIFIGSDSRLTADGDLLDEFNCLRAHGLWDNNYLHNNPLSNDAPLSVGKNADFIINPDWEKRSGHGLIVKNGIPQIGNAELMTLFPHIETINAQLDNVPKQINIHLARQISRCTLQESGLVLLEEPKRQKRFLML